MINNTNVQQQLATLRELISRSSVEKSLINDKCKWLQLTSCLDVLEDTDLAIQAYRSMEYPNIDNSELDFGRKY